MNEHELDQTRRIIGSVIRDIFGKGSSLGVRDYVREVVIAAARAHGEAMGKAMAEAKKGER